MKNTGIGNTAKACGLLLVVASMCACATVKPMALTPGQRSLDTSVESLVLMTLRTSNAYKPGYQPEVACLAVSAIGVQDSEVIAFLAAEPHMAVEDQYNEYLVSFSVAPGKHRILEILGRSSGFLISGAFSVPVFKDFEVLPDQIVYLGRVEATNREQRHDDELAAGPPLPWIDQAATGYSGGTFDVSIVDNYEVDIALFRNEFAALKGRAIDKQVLEPWHRRTDEELEAVRISHRIAY